MSNPTELYLPAHFPYPIKVISLDVNSTASISRGTRLLSYSFVYIPSGPGARPETRFGTWDSATEGQVHAWKVNQGDVITERRAQQKPVILVTEPCKHGVQIGGLCGLCGKDMTEYVSLGVPLPGGLLMQRQLRLHGLLRHLSRLNTDDPFCVRPDRLLRGGAED
jgi:RNA polymerase II subunit A C-terminal domain phosphatase